MRKLNKKEDELSHKIIMTLGSGNLVTSINSLTIVLATLYVMLRNKMNNDDELKKFIENHHNFIMSRIRRGSE